MNDMNDIYREIYGKSFSAHIKGKCVNFNYYNHLYIIPESHWLLHADILHYLNPEMERILFYDKLTQLRK